MIDEPVPVSSVIRSPIACRQRPKCVGGDSGRGSEITPTLHRDRWSRPLPHRSHTLSPERDATERIPFRLEYIPFRRLFVLSIGWSREEPDRERFNRWSFNSVSSV